MTVKIGDLEFNTHPSEGMTLYTPQALADMPTLSTGQADDLKVDDGYRRYWLARCSSEDGEEWQVHVEDRWDGKWEQWLSYRVRS